MKFALLLLALSACAHRPPCNPADELDAIQAGEPTCSTLRAEEKARRRAAFGDGLSAMGGSFAAQGQGQSYTAPPTPTRFYSVQVGNQRVNCREDARGNVFCF